MSHSVELHVRYAETDQMGRAHHSHYLVWCELGRTALMRDAGASYSRLEERGVQLPVSRAELEYRQPLRYDAAVRIETRLEQVRSRKIVFSYRIVSVEDGIVAATARTELVSIDSDGRPTRLPPDVRELLESLQEEHLQSDFS